MYYRRVIPRDLFNEAKLLKCLGQLSLIIHDGLDDSRTAVPAGLRIVHDGEAFEIEQDPSDGAIYCTTLDLFSGDTRLALKSPCNSRLQYPLMCEHEEDEAFVFNDDGTLSDHFLELLATVPA